MQMLISIKYANLETHLGKKVKVKTEYEMKKKKKHCKHCFPQHRVHDAKEKICVVETSSD